MKPFVFRLQIVLERAREEEEELLRRLALLRAEKTRKEEEMTAATAQRRQLMQTMAAMQQQSFDAWELHQCHMHLSALGDALEQLHRECAEIEERVLAAQQAVVEAMRKRQLLEKLRQKQYDTYRAAAERQELRAMEETTLPRRARERMEELARWERQRERSGED